ncbi:MAG: hypothetical protein WA431_01430 [Candidatus Cybelea sp.]
MTLRADPLIMLAAVLLLITSGCAAQAVPSSNGANPAPPGPGAFADRPPADMTSILKKLKKDVIIGSTVDTKNGDKGPRAISIAPRSKGLLRKGQLLVCNFESSAGVPGNGTTMEILNPASSSTPMRFVQSDSIKGCDGDGLGAQGGSSYGAGLASGKVVEVSSKGVPERTFGGQAIKAPFADTIALPEQPFSPEYVFVSTTSGGIASISVGFYGNDRATEVATGFGVTTQSGQTVLAPSGLQYDPATDVLYIVDGVTDTIVAFSNASELLDKDEIIVKPGGKTFKCEHPKATCASLVYSGSPLDAPMAATLLPNGNLIVANTGGTANTLVELTPHGQVLDTKVVDSSSTQGVFGLAASGTSDSNTVLFYADTNSNTVHELSQ